MEISKINVPKKKPFSDDMLYPHSLPSAEASSFLAILHHFKKVLKFQLLLRETRNKKRKRKFYNFLLSFLQISLFFSVGGGNLKHFPNFFYYFFSFFFHLSLTLGFVCLECTIVCVAAANTAPPPFFSVFSFFRNQNQNWYLVSVRLALRHAPVGRRAIPNISSFMATLAARSGVSLVALGRVVYLLLRTSVGFL